MAKSLKVNRDFTSDELIELRTEFPNIVWRDLGQQRSFRCGWHWGRILDGYPNAIPGTLPIVLARKLVVRCCDVLGNETGYTANYVITSCNENVYVDLLIQSTIKEAAEHYRLRLQHRMDELVEEKKLTERR